jgi:hypothetical protein
MSWILNPVLDFGEQNSKVKFELIIFYHHCVNKKYDIHNNTTKIFKLVYFFDLFVDDQKLKKCIKMKMDLNQLNAIHDHISKSNL